MNLDELKEVLGEAKHKALAEYVGELTAQRDQARGESINHRKSLKAKAEQLEALNRKLFDKLGIDTEEELEALPDGKGQAEVNKQLEAKLKRLERERDEAVKKTGELTTQVEKDRRSAVIAKAVAKHGFVDADTAALILERGIRVEGDQILYEAEGGKLIPVDEGAAFIAKTKPFLVKASGGSGSGYREGGNDKPGAKQMARSEFEALAPEARMKAVKDKVQLTD